MREQPEPAVLPLLLTLLDRHARAFGERRLGDMLDDHAFPYPIHLEDRLLVLRTRADLLGALDAYRRLMAFRGVTAVTPHVERIEEAGGRGRAWVRWAHHGPGGTDPEGSRAVLYLGRASDGRLLVEMTDYTHLSLRDMKAWQPRAA
jgi:hypothetical protein